MASMNHVTEGKMKKAQKSPAPRRIDVATRLDELTELAMAEFDKGYAGVAFALQSAEGEVDVGFVRHEDARDRINEIPGLWPSYRLGESFFPEPKP